MRARLVLVQSPGNQCAPMAGDMVTRRYRVVDNRIGTDKANLGLVFIPRSLPIEIRIHFALTFGAPFSQASTEGAPTAKARRLW